MESVQSFQNWLNNNVLPEVMSFSGSTVTVSLITLGDTSGNVIANKNIHTFVAMLQHTIVILY